MLDKISYFIRRSLLNMRQWPFLCIASILTMAIALATVATFFLVVMNIEQIADKWSEELQAGTIFLNRCDYLDPELAWTGYKNSGKGSGLSKHCFSGVTQLKSIHFKIL